MKYWLNNTCVQSWTLVKAGVWEFLVKAERSKVISSLLYGLMTKVLISVLAVSFVLFSNNSLIT